LVVSFIYDQGSTKLYRSFGRGATFSPDSMPAAWKLAGTRVQTPNLQPRLPQILILLGKIGKRVYLLSPFLRGKR
jgi:hypothetical protein